MAEAQLLSLVIVALVCMVAILQVCLALGLPLGEFAWGGKYKVLPTGLRIASALSIVFLGLAAWVAMARANVLPPGPDHSFTRVGAWVFAGFFTLNTLGNILSKSPAERYGMTPPALTLLLCFLALGLLA